MPGRLSRRRNPEDETRASPGLCLPGWSDGLMKNQGPVAGLPDEGHLSGGVDFGSRCCRQLFFFVLRRDFLFGLSRGASLMGTFLATEKQFCFREMPRILRAEICFWTSKNPYFEDTFLNASELRTFWFNGKLSSI